MFVGAAIGVALGEALVWTGVIAGGVYCIGTHCLGDLDDLLGNKQISMPFPTDFFSKQTPGYGSGKPDGCATGTKPIDQMGLNKDQVHGIKKGIGAGAKDWTGIDTEGNIWTGDGEGGSINHGPFESYLP